MTYTIAETLVTTRRVEFIDRKDVAKTVLYENIEAFIVHISSLNLRSITIHSAQNA